MDDKKYDSRYDGETTDKILDNAKAIMEQTTAEDGETVQVYDTNGVPHKVSKTELLKKSTLALPALEDISSFVAVNAAGNAIGLMTKEQVASVLAELIGVVSAEKDGLMARSGFLSAIGLNLEGDANNVNNGVYKFDSQQDNMPVNYGILVAFSCDGWIRMQLCAGGDNGLAYIRMHYNSWTSWKQL